MSDNYFDQASRYLLRTFRKPLLPWFFRLEAKEINFVDWVDTRNLPWPGESDRYCDTVVHLSDRETGGVPWAVAIEFQIDPDPTMFGRALGYLSGLWMSRRPYDGKDRFEVGILIVNLRGKGNASRNMRLSKTSIRTMLTALEWNFAQESAEKTIGQMEQNMAPVELLPWIPLFRGANKPSIISRWKKLADAQTDRELRKCLGLAVLFAEAVECKEPGQEALKGWNMIESEVVKEWTLLARQEALKQGKLEGVKEGKLEGLREGEKKGKQATLRLILQRWGVTIPQELEQAVAGIEDLQRLDEVTQIALQAKNLDAFRRKANL